MCPYTNRHHTNTFYIKERIPKWEYRYSQGIQESNLYVMQSKCIAFAISPIPLILFPQVVYLKVNALLCLLQILYRRTSFFPSGSADVF